MVEIAVAVAVGTVAAGSVRVERCITLPCWKVDIFDAQRCFWVGW
jgi:hypothetical protein